MEVQDEGDELGGVFGVGYNGDLVLDPAVCIRILRGGSRASRAWGRCLEGSIVGGWTVEEGLRTKSVAADGTH